MIGKTISHYKIIEELGAGGMGVVYKAEDTKLKRTVALKFLPPELTRDAEAKARFIREAQAASALEHPNICNIHEIDETEDGQMFIIMACYEGETLKEKIKEKRLKKKEAIDIAIQIAEGAAKAHEKGIVHRDIKPANIFITNDGQVKILDFGLAKLVGQAQLTKDSSTLGTVAYMSPEQLSGKEVDQRSDIWSLGVVLYEMLTGTLPFSGDYEQAIIYSILNEEPKRLDNIPTELQDVVQKALHKNPDERYQYVDGFSADLKKIKKELESKKTDYQEPDAPTTKKPVKIARWKQPITILITVITIVLVIFGLQWILEQGTEKQLEKSIAVLPFTSITKSEEDNSFTEGIHDDILTQLAKIGDLKVIARTSVMQYKNTEKRISEIAKELSVNSILEGTVRRVGNQIRISAQLIDAITENHIWAETYDREYSDIFTIQSDVALKIAIALKAQLTPEEKRSISKKPTENIEAYNHYLKANYYFNNYYSKEEYIEAARMYEKAIELDPDFVFAYTQLVKINTLLYNYKTWDPTPERLRKCEETLSNVIELAPDVPEVRAARGYYLEWIKKDYKQALAEYETAILKLPNNSVLYGNIGTLFLRQGKADVATEYFIKSYERDPKAKGQGHTVSWAYMLQRNWIKAEQWIDNVISSQPEYVLAYYKKIEICIWGYGNLEKASEVIAEGSKHIARFDKTYYPSMIALYSRDYPKAYTIIEAESARPEVYLVEKAGILNYLNKHKEARATYEYAKSLLEELITKSPDNAFYYIWLGLAYAGLGNKYKAIQYGKKAIELHPIHSDPWSSGEDILLDMAHINIMVGEHEKAINQIETLLNIPSQLTKWRLRLDPVYDPIRSNPRFQELIAED